MAHAVGYELVIFGTSADGGNSHAAANRQGIPAILVETGQLGDRDPATVRRLLDALYRILHHLGAIEAPEHIKQPTVQPRDWIWTGDVESPVAGLWYPGAVTGDEVTEGQTIGRLIDPVDGAERKITANATGKIIYNMNGLSVRPGTHLAAIAAPHH
ncbi:succinylglutamate desuccinylase/aspartoacylase family protein [Streptomyces bicolor]|uniref:succinylglutamate desuccinylase/aspartoacylase family protein n=1 Tax=Streptomyces bicolor TaxID=66874 RepID=UPI0004E1A019|nr:succinylglutamate desuccinylase/aspartoacylase family protein [Streptomyces bicolor]